MPKKRLDQLLVEQNLATSLSHAIGLIMAGEVIVNDQRITKAGELVSVDAEIRFKSENIKYVSRGGLKLEGALHAFKINPTGKICIDVGASTGGFTDCLLQYGAKHVFTFDVGTRQLDQKLQKDPRVTWKESFHAKELSPTLFPKPIDMAVVDVSFISLEKVLPFVVPCITKGGILLAMIKPQFEVHPKHIAKGGVVKTEPLRLEAIEKVKAFVENTLQIQKTQLADAAIKGPNGNQETFLYGLV